jgi:nucleic acid/nucleotide deaminase of polymorphic system toxin
MALRPAGKTLLSLTGVVVLAAVLWLLLNFVYAPSCGRFACGYEPAWLPSAQADSGGCPDDVGGAATDALWAADRLATIVDEPVTKGLLYDEDGMEHPFTSSPRDEHADRVNELLRELGYLPPGATTSLADHVEAKVAALMRRLNRFRAGTWCRFSYPKGPP